MSQYDTPFAKAVASLGETPESVISVLRVKSIKGYRFSAVRCPIARYLNACGFPNVTVGMYANRYCNSEREAPSDETVSLCQGVKNWICNFDDGKYPEFYQES